MTRKQIAKAGREFLHSYEGGNPAQWAMVDFAIQQVNAALEEAADEVAKRVIGGRAWNENQALEGRVVAACAATVRARKIP